jgi:hypothetical protein
MRALPHWAEKAPREHPGNGGCEALGPRGALTWSLAKVAAACAARWARRRYPQPTARCILRDSLTLSRGITYIYAFSI